MSKLLFLWLLAATICVAECQAQSNKQSPGRWPRGQEIPKVSSITGRLIGGNPSENPRVVGIQTYRKNGAGPFICSGVLVSKNIILTAAHCTCGMGEFGVTNVPLTVGVSWFPAEKIEEFGNFCKMGQPVGDDLALLKVITGTFDDKDGEPIEFERSLRDLVPYSFRSLREVLPSMRVEGYGFKGDEAGSLGLRREAKIGVDSFGCVESWIRWTGCAPLYEFVMGIAPTRGRRIDTCGGDSGGPVFAKDKNNKDYLVGIVSRGVPLAQPYSRGECGAGGIYTYLGRKNVIAWLEKSIAANEPDSHKAKNSLTSGIGEPQPPSVQPIESHIVDRPTTVDDDNCILGCSAPSNDTIESVSLPSHVAENPHVSTGLQFQETALDLTEDQESRQQSSLKRSADTFDVGLADVNQAKVVVEVALDGQLPDLVVATEETVQHVSISTRSQTMVISDGRDEN